jgi:hypothetical protein
MFGRIYFVCHWALDTVAGASLGASAVLLTNWLIGIKEVEVTHFAGVVGVAFAFFSLMHVIGVLPVDVKGIQAVLMPPTRPK